MSHPTRKARVLNPAPAPNPCLGPGHHRVILHDTLIGHVTGSGSSWYAEGIEGERMGPFYNSQAAAEALKQIYTDAPALAAIPVTKKLKSRLLR